MNKKYGKNNKLTARELEVLRRLKDGKTSGETAQLLDITERTVKFHISNILRKLRAGNRTHAVATAMGQGLI